MLSVANLTRQDLGKAASYYGDGADDYYAKEGEAAMWQGEGAERLGLEGEVDRDQFKNLLAGKLPDGSRVNRATRGENTKERIGLDLTFSAPKSVSIQALIGRDPEIIKAHDRAVATAVAEAEKRAMARRKVGGKAVIEHTANLVVAKFRHETSRELDPQLHTHAVVMNLTQRADGEWRALKNDDIVKQLKYLGSVYQAELAVELQGLGYQLRQEKDGTWELAHISRDQLAEFSRRSQQIEERLAAKGITRDEATAAEKQAATMQTRAKKEPHADRDAIFEDWTRRAKDLNIDFSRREWQADHGHERTEPGKEMGKDRAPERDRERDSSSDPRRPSTDAKGGDEKGRGRDADSGRSAPEAEQGEADPGQNPGRGKARTSGLRRPNEEAARLAVRYAVNHLTERESIMRESDLKRVALTHALGAARMTDIEREIKEQTGKGFLLRESAVYRPIDQVGKADSHTRSGWIEQLVKGGMTKQAAQLRVDEGISSGRLQTTDARLSTQTAVKREKAILAIERVGRGAVTPALTKDQLTAALQGTRLNDGQRASAELILTTPNRVVGVQGLAGTGKSFMLTEASRQLVKEGFDVKVLAPYGSQVKDLRKSQLDARTLASFLKGDRHIGTLNDKSVIVLDEAGIVPARLMERLMKVVEQKGARLVLLGDTEQTKAIEAGRPFAQLQASGMALSQMAEIQRQKSPELKRAVELAASGRSADSIKEVKQVHEVKDPHERRAALVAAFIEQPPQDRENALIITGTNDARREINQRLRDEFGTAGKGHEHEVLLRMDSTQAERRFSRNYAVGDVIQPEKDYANGMKRGDTYRVLDTGPGNVLTVASVEDPTKTIAFSPLTHTKISVYKAEKLEFSVGDQVRITRNDAAQDLANGDRFRVVEVTPTSLVLDDGGKRVELATDKPLHVDHAYVSTVHGSQGLTCDRVFYEADSSSRTTARDVYYVAISRARQEAVIFTDDLSKLPRAIARENIKGAALDLRRDRYVATPRNRAQQLGAKPPRAAGYQSQRGRPAPAAAKPTRDRARGTERQKGPELGG